MDGEAVALPTLMANKVVPIATAFVDRETVSELRRRIGRRPERNRLSVVDCERDLHPAGFIVGRKVLHFLVGVERIPVLQLPVFPPDRPLRYGAVFSRSPCASRFPGFRRC